MKHTRLILGIILILLLFALMSYYSLDHNNHDPDPKYIIDHYKQFNTTKVTLTGDVKNVDRTNHTLLIQLSSSPGDILLVSTTEPLNSTQPGDVVEVYGTLSSGTHITAETVLISERWKNNLIYVRSLPAIPFALYLFFSTWRFNRSTRRFERRQKHT